MPKNDTVLLDGIIDDRTVARIPSERRDEAFEHLAFEQILKDFDLSADELQAGSLDGRQDAGIDGAFIFVNGHFLQDPESFIWPKTGCQLQAFIITCKHHDTFKQATLDALAASLTELLDLALEDSKLRGAYSDSVRAFRSNLRFAYRKLSPRLSSFSVQVVYASRGDTSAIGAEVRARAAQIETIVTDAFGACQCRFSFLGSQELVELYRKKPTYALELQFMEALARGERYVLLSEISEYFRFITDNGTLRRYLFESNVRDFMGLNRVNDDIRQTLESSGPTDFWWLNNGITILASSASVVGKAIQMQDIQIVNGLQTTESIYRFFSSGGQDAAKRSVLVKVIVTKDDAVKDSIIRATNNQTAVELVSLHATDKIQRDIEDVLLRHGLFYDRRTNYYHNMGRSTEEIVSPLYLAAGFVALVLKWPSKASRLKSRFMRNPDSYSKVFSPAAPLEVWPKIAKLLKGTDTVLESLRPGGKGGERFLKNWRYIVGLLVVVDSLGRFDFGCEGLLKVPDGAASETKVRDLWLLLNQYLTRLGGQSGLTDRSTTIELCRMYATDRGAQGLEGMAYRACEIRDENRRESLPLTSELIERVKQVLPKQPWKPGLHKDIAGKLQISTTQYFSAVEALIEEGVFCHQRDGVLYDRDGNVVGFDADRVDPETMMLKERLEE